MEGAGGGKVIMAADRTALPTFIHLRGKRETEIRRTWPCFHAIPWCGQALQHLRASPPRPSVFRLVFPRAYLQVPPG